MHIKIIDGKKYYYESVRKGKKVTSKYIGPVEPLRKSRKKAADQPINQSEPVN